MLLFNLQAKLFFQLAKIFFQLVKIFFQLAKIFFKLAKKKFHSNFVVIQPVFVASDALLLLVGLGLVRCLWIAQIFCPLCCLFYLCLCFLALVD